MQEKFLSSEKILKPSATVLFYARMRVKNIAKLGGFG